MKALTDYLHKNPKKKLIFDLDATILELLLPWDIWLEQLKTLILEKDPQMWETYTQGERSVHQVMNDFVKKYGKESKKHITNLSTEFENIHLKGIRNNNELIDFIKTNKDNYKMYIWSSNTEQVIINALEEVGILSHFEKIVSQTIVTYIKPDPDGFSLIHDGESELEKYLFVGDSKSDEGVTAALGMDFFKVSF